jgi:hypothetical protein
LSELWALSQIYSYVCNLAVVAGSSSSSSSSSSGSSSSSSSSRTSKRARTDYDRNSIVSVCARWEK